MTMITYILRKIIENSNYPLFNICPMYFLGTEYEKFKGIKIQVIDNNFFTEDQKNIYLNLFCKAQKHYYAFSKFAKIWKLSKYKYYDNRKDLCFNPLSNFPESQKITLVHLKKKYIFRLTDLMNLWESALFKNDNLNPYPSYPRNPYINKSFHRYHLFCIYFKLLESTFAIPLLIQQFYKLEFNIVKFELITYPILKDNAIKNYIDTESNTVLFLDIINMIESLRVSLDYAYIDSRLPLKHIKDVVKHIKPFLHDYFVGLFSCNTLKKEMAMTSAINGLTLFFRQYPIFGTLRYYGIDPNTMLLLRDSEEEMNI